MAQSGMHEKQVLREILARGPNGRDYVGRGAWKLIPPLLEWGLAEMVEGAVCADVGANVGGFTDVLLLLGAERVYAVEKGRHRLDYSLKYDRRVVNMEGTNALYFSPPEPIDFVVVDIGWTLQKMILPVVKTWIKKGGHLLSLVKLQYEAGEEFFRVKGKNLLSEAKEKEWLDNVVSGLSEGVIVERSMRCPVVGKKARSPEYWIHIPF